VILTAEELRPSRKGDEHDRCVEFVRSPASIASIWRRSITWAGQGRDRRYRLLAAALKQSGKAWLGQYARAASSI